MPSRIWMWASAALFLCLLGLWSWAQAQKIDAMETREKALKVENSILKADLQNAEDDARRAVDALQSMTRDLEERRRASDASLKEIDNAPQTDDGPVAPVLRRVLDGMRR